MRGSGCRFKWTQPHSFQPTFSYCLASALCTSSYRSSSPGWMTRVMESSECPPGTERLVTIPSSLSSLKSKSWGWVLVHAFLGHLAALVIRVPSLKTFLHWQLFGRNRGCGAGRCTSLHILFSLFNHNIWVMLDEAVINHGDITGIPLLLCWRGHIQLMAAFHNGTTLPLLFLFLNLILPWHGGGMANLHGISEGHLMGLSPLVHQLSSPLYSMRVKEVWAIFNPAGWMSHRKTSHFEGWDPPLLVLWLCHPLISCLLLDLLWDLPPCLIVSDPHLSCSQVLLPGLQEGVQWLPIAIWVCWYSSHLCLLFSYWDWLSIPWKKGAQTNAMCSQTP